MPGRFCRFPRRCEWGRSRDIRLIRREVAAQARRPIERTGRAAPVGWASRCWPIRQSSTRERDPQGVRQADVEPISGVAGALLGRALGLGGLGGGRRRRALGAGRGGLVRVGGFGAGFFLGLIPQLLELTERPEGGFARERLFRQGRRRCCRLRGLGRRAWSRRPLGPPRSTFSVPLLRPWTAASLASPEARAGALAGTAAPPTRPLTLTGGPFGAPRGRLAPSALGRSPGNRADGLRGRRGPLATRGTSPSPTPLPLPALAAAPAFARLRGAATPATATGLRRAAARSRA